MDESTPKSRERSGLWQAVGFAWDFGLLVVIPLVVLGIGGRYLDRKLETSPWLFLGGVVLSIIISTVLVVMKLSSIIKDVTNPPAKP